MGSLLTVSGGGEIDGIANGGAVFLDFVAGTVTLPAGSQGNLTRTMNKNLNDLGLTQCIKSDQQFHSRTISLIT